MATQEMNMDVLKRRQMIIPNSQSKVFACFHMPPDT